MRRLSTAATPCLALFIALLPGTALADLYAAIAYSTTTGKAGTAWNYDSQSLAETEAYSQCGVEDCDTVLWFTQCGAIAVGDGFGYGTGYDLSLATATDTALQNCDGFAANCQITAAFCNEGY